MYLDQIFIDLEGKISYNFWTKIGNSGHSDRDERKKYERIAAASIDQTVFTHGRKKK